MRVEDVEFDTAELMNELLPVLRAADAEHLAKPAAWAGTLVNECRHALSAVLPFTNPEREFLDCILDLGEIAPTLLTNDPDLAQRIASHPMLQWKAAKCPRAQSPIVARNDDHVIANTRPADRRDPA